MKPSTRVCTLALATGLGGWAAAGGGREAIRLAAEPVLSPDGTVLVFNWDGDLWRAPTRGGRATPLTTHPAQDRWAAFSPDGAQIAFQSDRTGPAGIYVMPARGGSPRQITTHTEGFIPLEWYPDGNGILASVWRDYGGLSGQRLVRVDPRGGREEELIVDAYGEHGTLSPDGGRMLFTREGMQLYRKGYQGSNASQIWLVDLATKTFVQPVSDPGGCRSPLWRPDGRGFYYVCARSGCFNLWEHDLDTGKDTQHTFEAKDAVILPSISRDGSTIVFRNLFDFYRYHPGTGEAPARIALWHTLDRGKPAARRQQHDKVWNNGEWGSLDWTDDGLEMVFTAGGDAYVMDTVLREPRLVAGDSASQELEAVFTPDREQILLLRDTGDRVAICRATRGDPDRYWWQNDRFVLETLNDDPTSKVNLTVSPDGSRIAYVQNERDLYLADLDGGNPRPVCAAAEMPFYEWSPDSRWLACSMKDSYDNWDIWIVSTDGSEPPFNLSRHPNYDSAATWSPDGRMLAFIGEREINKELDLFYVYLRKKDHDELARDRMWDEATEKMRKERKEDRPPPEESDGRKADASDDPPPAPDDAEKSAGPADAPGGETPPPPGETAKPAKVEVVIDFDGLADRVRRIELSGSRETAPFWSYDAKALAFTSTINGRQGTYKVVFPEAANPEFVNARTGTYARWTEKGSKILWLSDGVPYAFTEGYPFQVRQEVDLKGYRRLAFRLVWRNLKDSFYDDGFNNLDWDDMLGKYEDIAAAAPDQAAFERVVYNLQGELNASHLWFSGQASHWDPWRAPDKWSEQTAHLGVRFDPAHSGPGWRVSDVLRGGPADLFRSRLHPGDLITGIDGREIEPGVSRAVYLNGHPDRVIRLAVTGGDGAEREVRLRPVAYARARELLWEQWIEENRRRVDDLSGGALAYVHVDKMNWETFYRFEQEIFSVGYGKAGLIIDVRNNGGGFTADHLLSILCRPNPSTTVPRGGEESYPRGYLSHLSWDKPIVVLCNQNTASNGEIFSHAIKALGRGKLVGVPTQGSVISTPSVKILDLGTLSIPRRGWFTKADGEDMEGHGAVPDIAVWPHPGDIPAGRDEQLRLATEALLEDVAAYEARPRPPFRYARERTGPAASARPPGSG